MTYRFCYPEIVLALNTQQTNTQQTNTQQTNTQQTNTQQTNTQQTKCNIEVVYMDLDFFIRKDKCMM